MKTSLSTACELAGLAVLAVGLWMLAPWLGVAVGGVGLVAVGVALDPPRKPQPPPEGTG